MSKDIIDVDQFTSPVHVPEGLDSRDHAAEDVEAIAQALANRTLSLKNRADVLEAGVAYRAQDNRFTAHNKFDHALENVGTDAEEPLLVSHGSPADVGSAWRLITSHRQSVAAAGVYRYAQTYVGSNASDVEGALLICVNAVWNKATSLWQLQFPGTDACAIIWHRGKVRVSRIAANTAPWPSWPTGFVAGQIGSAFNTQVQGEYNYLTTRLRTFPLDLANAYGPLKRNADGSVQVVDLSGAGTTVGTIGVPLRLAAGTKIGNIEMMVSIAFQPSADDPSVLSTLNPPIAELLRRINPNWTASPPVPPAVEIPAISVQAPTNTPVDPYIIVLPTAGMTIDVAKEYQVTYTAQAADKLLAIRVRDWEDPGPRNIAGGG